MDEGLQYLISSAKHGDLDSITALSAYYLVGEGVPKDEEKGMQLLFTAARAGHAEAQRRLGDIAKEVGHSDEAFKWFEAAANQGNHEAMAKLGMWFYFSGTAVPQDKKKAKQLLERAQATRDPKLQQLVRMQLRSLSFK